jgi:hypothetical protein
VIIDIYSIDVDENEINENNEDLIDYTQLCAFFVEKKYWKRKKLLQLQ